MTMPLWANFFKSTTSVMTGIRKPGVPFGLQRGYFCKNYHQSSQEYVIYMDLPADFFKKEKSYYHRKIVESRHCLDWIAKSQLGIEN